MLAGCRFALNGCGLHADGFDGASMPRPNLTHLLGVCLTVTNLREFPLSFKEKKAGGITPPALAVELRLADWPRPRNAS